MTILVTGIFLRKSGYHAQPCMDYGPLTPCQVSEKTNEPIGTTKKTSGWMHGWTEGPKDTQTQFHSTLSATIMASTKVRIKDIP